jgi:hypothetical protein
MPVWQLVSEVLILHTTPVWTAIKAKLQRACCYAQRQVHSLMTALLKRAHTVLRSIWTPARPAVMLLLGILGLVPALIGIQIVLVCWSLRPQVITFPPL